MKTFELPDLGEGLKEAEIVSWHVSEGDHVTTDQPLVSVETDKAVVEVPAPRSGVIVKLFAKEGDRIEVGATLVEFEDGGQADKGAVVGDLDKNGTGKTLNTSGSGGRNGSGKVKATPQVRAMARKMDIDLGLVEPTGPNGTITASDIERAAKTLSSSGPAEELTGVRRAMAERMARAHEEVVRATVTEYADITNWKKGTPATARLILAIAAGCKAESALNAWFDGTKMERRINQGVHLGLAVDTPDGLFVPVLRDAQNLTLETAENEVNRLKKAVNDRNLPPEDMRGATISLSNYGSMGGVHSEMVVVPPQVAIVGAGRTIEQLVLRDGSPKETHLMPLSLTFDHRAVTGGEAVRFLNRVKMELEL